MKKLFIAAFLLVASLTNAQEPGTPIDPDMPEFVVGDTPNIYIVEENEPTRVTGTIKVTIICQNGDTLGEWHGVGVDANGQYYILHSFIANEIDESTGKLHPVRRTLGYKWQYPWTPLC